MRERGIASRQRSLARSLALPSFSRAFPFSIPYSKMADAPPRGLVNVRANGEAARRAKKDKRNNIVSLMAEQFERVRVPSLSLFPRFFFILPPAFSSSSLSSFFLLLLDPLSLSLSSLSPPSCSPFGFSFTSEELLVPLRSYSSSRRHLRCCPPPHTSHYPAICVRACPFALRHTVAIPQESYQKGNT